ncbi:MAG: tetratricopeptide repeat protein [Deltaproteobacteria bacterium]|nr:tetratricopeptide repeat protein [Deltaproteobacteria bacterium]
MSRAGFIILLLFAVSAGSGQDVSFAAVDNMIEELRLNEAEKLIPWIKANPEEIAYLKGKLAFYRGKYEEAYINFSSIRKEDYIVKCALNARSIVSGFKKYETANFIILYPDEKEEVYLEYLADGLENGLKILSPVFGFEPSGKIRIEILARQSDLEKLTTLPLEAIEKTNTIAVTKFNKIMISSPRTQLEGYDYTGTAVHELIHFMISSVTYERAPVWIHEALARYFDRYSQERLPSLRPDTLALLRQRYEKKNLIAFEQIHPSMALLPSQEDTAVAFAEVFLVSEFLHKRFGNGFVKSLLEMLREKRDMDYIFKKFGYGSFKEFEKEYFTYLVKRVEKYGYTEHLFYETVSKKGKKKEYLGDVYAMKYVKLGDLLFLENLYDAAYVEYEKASKSGPINPHIENRKAFSLINAKRFSEAAVILEKIKDLYPDYYSTFVNLSRAYLSLKEYSKALDSLERAVRINPFDREIHLMFLRVFTDNNNQYEAEKVKRKIELLSQKN